MSQLERIGLKEALNKVIEDYDSWIDEVDSLAGNIKSPQTLAQIQAIRSLFLFAESINKPVRDSSGLSDFYLYLLAKCEFDHRKAADLYNDLCSRINLDNVKEQFLLNTRDGFDVELIDTRNWLPNFNRE